MSTHVIKQGFKTMALSLRYNFPKEKSEVQGTMMGVIENDTFTNKAL